MVPRRPPCPKHRGGKGVTVTVGLFCSQKLMDVFPGKGASATLNTQSWEIWKVTLVVSCGHDLWLPPGERRSFPGKFTGFFSQTEHSIWFPEVTVPQLGMQDFPLASCLYLCRAKSGGWSLAEASRIPCKTVHIWLCSRDGELVWE